MCYRGGGRTHGLGGNTLDGVRVARNDTSGRWGGSTLERITDCASRKSRNLREYEGYPSIIMLTDAHFSQVMSSNSALDFTFACCAGAREHGSAPPNRRASEVRCKTSEINLWRPPLVDLFVPPVARLALSAGHRQARNGRGLASSRLSPLLDLESAARPTRTTRHSARGPIRKMCRENPLW